MAIEEQPFNFVMVYRSQHKIIKKSDARRGDNDMFLNDLANWEKSQDDLLPRSYGGRAKSTRAGSYL